MSSTSLSSQDQHLLSAAAASRASSVRESYISVAGSTLGATHQLIEELEKASGDADSINFHAAVGPLRSSASPKLPPSSSQVATDFFQFPTVASMSTNRSQLDTIEMMTQKELQLENLCHSLQKQVSELRDLITASVNFGVGVISASHDLTDTGSCIQQNLDKECSLTRAASFPPPVDLSVGQLSSSRAVIHWKHPSVAVFSGRPSVKSKNQLIACRVFINGEAEGLVGGPQTHVVLTDLTPDHNYRVFLRAIYSLGESTDSTSIQFRTLPNRTNTDGMETNSSSDESDCDKHHCRMDGTAKCHHGGGPSSATGAGNASLTSHLQEDIPSAAEGGSSGKETNIGSSSVSNTTSAAQESSSVIDKRLGAGANRTFPSRNLSTDDSDVRPISTYPLDARKSLDHLLRGSVCTSKDGISGANDVMKFTAKMSPSPVVHASPAAICIELEQSSVADEEKKFIPKPPDESVLTRRNSLTRRGSLRRRNESGSSQPVVEAQPGTDEINAITVVHPMSSPNLSSVLLKAESSCASSIMDSGGRKVSITSITTVAGYSGSESESKSSPEDLSSTRSHRTSRDIKSPSEQQRSERRSSSMGAVARHSSAQRDKTLPFADKPPAGRRDSSTDRGGRHHDHDNTGNSGKIHQGAVPNVGIVATDKHVTTTTTATGGVPSVVGGVVPQLAKDGHRSSIQKVKKLFGHKRSKSDLRYPANSGSQSPIRPATASDPTVPTPSSSPRILRSSSFSGRGDGSQSSALRQAISLEALKAATKAISAQHPVAATESKPGPESLDQQPDQSVRTAAITDHSLYEERTPDRPTSVVSVTSSPPRPVGTHSPRLAVRRSSPDDAVTGSSVAATSQHHHHLSNKAASLFAQLQKRISTNGNSSSSSSNINSNM
jgi:hypothetical protein